MLLIVQVLSQRCTEPNEQIMPRHRVTTRVPLLINSNQLGVAYSLRTKGVLNSQMDDYGPILAFGDFNTSKFNGSFIADIRDGGLTKVFPFTIGMKGLAIDFPTKDVYCKVVTNDDAKILVVKMNMDALEVEKAIHLNDSENLDAHSLVFSGEAGLIYVTASSKTEYGMEHSI